MSHIRKSNVNADNVYLAPDSSDTESTVFVPRLWGFGVQGDAGARGLTRGAPGAICSARCESLGLLITSELDRQTRRRSHHPGRTTPLGLLAGRRGALQTEGWFCPGFASESPKYPGAL